MTRGFPRLAAAACFLWSWSAAWPQDAGGVLKGEAHPDSPMLHLMVRLDSPHDQLGAETEVQADGTFELRNVPYGVYTLSIQDEGGNVLKQELVSVDASTARLTLHVAEPRLERPSGHGVSMIQLRHPPARKAIQAFAAAQKLSGASQYAAAAAQLEKAISISPWYAEARTNLGAQYVRLRRYSEALEQLTRAIEIGGPNETALTNVACALASLERFPEAILSARQALSMNPDFAPAHYILGSILLREGGKADEGMKHLEAAAATIPGARALLESAESRK